MMFLASNRKVRAAREMPLVAALCAIAVLAAGCRATTTSIIGRETKHATFTVDTDPSGAEIYVNGKLQPERRTPATLAIPYERAHRRTVVRQQKAGWTLLSVGLLMAALGSVGIWGATVMSDPASSDPPDEDPGVDRSAIVAGVSIALAVGGLASLMRGIYFLFSKPASHDRYEATPPALRIGVRLPDGRRPRVSIVPNVDALFEPIGTLRYRSKSDSWSAAGLGQGLRLIKMRPVKAPETSQ